MFLRLNQNLLIDAVVRQTMLLIAQLATQSGSRTPLAHVANQVFLDLVRELQNAGLGQKIIADMFGMALRTYHERVRRLSESATDRGRTLWEAVLGLLQEKGSLTRAAVLKRFRRDDPLVVRSVLNDLVDSGLVFRSGKGDRTMYRAAEPDQLAHAADDEEIAASLVWVAVHRASPCTREELEQNLSLEGADLEAALLRLVETGRVRREECGDTVQYSSESCIIPYEADSGWEGAVLDHYQAVVTAITTKLHYATRARSDDRVGGSTYSYDVWPGHPLESEVHGLLSEVRSKASDLRARVDAENVRLPRSDHATRVTFYVGQTIPLADEPAEQE